MNDSRGARVSRLAKAEAMAQRERMTGTPEDAAFYERLARNKRERLDADAYVWTGDMDERDVLDFPPDCKITITARQLAEIIDDVKWGMM